MPELFELTPRRGFVPTRVADKGILPVIEALEGRRLFAVYTVNSVSDTQGPDSNLTLVEAISLVNGNLVYDLLTSAERAQVNLSQPAGVDDTIDFNIPGMGTHEIDITHALPTIIKPVTIDGYSQPGSAVATSTTPAKIGVTLAGTSSTLAGLTIACDGTTVRGLSIVGFGAAAIQFNAVQASTGTGSSNDIIAGNWLGIEPVSGGGSGVTSSPNLIGVSLYQTSDDTIGGTTPADRNVIAANSRDGIDLLDTAIDVIEGNYIGVDPTGTTGIPNGTGIEMHDVNTQDNGIVIGGTTSSARNIISNNQGDGIYIHGTGPTNNTIEGNYIGTNAAGTKPLGNGADGVAIVGDGTTEVATIGGDSSSQRNVISGNHGSGISVDNAGHDSNGIVITNNYVGVSADGTAAMGNDQDGIYINSTRPVIGKAGAGNVIGANGSTNNDLSLSSGIVLDNVMLVSPFDPGISVVGNSIGTNAAGTAAFGNTGDGIYADNGYFLVLGGAGNANRNIISGNGHNGLTLETFGDAAVENDFIGVLADGKTAAGNKFDGVLVDSVSPYNSIGGVNLGDIIANSGLYGLELVGTDVGEPAYNLISENSIYDNGSLGISLEGGGNFNQAVPVISSAVYSTQSVTISGTVKDSPDTADTVEFFSNDKPDAGGYGQGRQYLGSINVTTDDNGNASFSSTLNMAIGSNLYISGTETGTAIYPGDTSGFAKTIKATPNLPAQPGNLKAVANSPTQVTLTWADNSNNETGFDVQRSTSSSFTSPTTFTVAANTTTYVDKTVSPSTTYYYRVQAVNALGGSAYATAVTVTTLTPLAAPGNLKAVANSPTQVTLTWADNSNNETGFDVQRSTSSSFTSPTTFTVAANTTTYVDKTVSPSTTYYYRVQAVNAGGGSAYATAVTVTTPSLPAAPGNLKAVANSPTQVTLTWADNSNNETSFELQRSTSSSFTSPTTFTVAANTTTYVDKTVSPSTTYYYRVQAVNAWGGSAYATDVKVSTPALPAAPGNLQAVANSPTQVTLTWADNSNNETSFELQRSTSSSFTSPTTFTVAANTTTYVDKAASPSTTYYYRVQAVNAWGGSAYATAAKVTTLIPLTMPGNLTGTAVAGPAVTLTWKDNASGETGYEIQVSTSSAFSTVTKDITVATPNLSNYKVTGLTAKTVYYFRVRAVSKTTPAIDSAWSSIVKTSTLSA